MDRITGGNALVFLSFNTTKGGSIHYKTSHDLSDSSVFWLDSWGLMEAKTLFLYKLLSTCL